MERIAFSESNVLDQQPQHTLLFLHLRARIAHEVDYETIVQEVEEGARTTNPKHRREALLKTVERSCGRATKRRWCSA
jgi:hypothetical protein